MHRVLALIVAAATASAGICAEPPTQLRVRLGDQDIRLDAGQSVEVRIDGKPVSLRVDELPFRRFAEAGIAFDYPRHFPWEFESPATWTLDGNSAVIIVLGAEKGEGADPDAVLDGIAQTLKSKRPAPRESILLATRNGPIDGVAMTVTLASSRIRNEAYRIEGRSRDVLLLLQDSLTDDGQASAEFVAMRKQLAQTLEF
ncbi:hypothetical protein [Dokdonella koreensis]|uniref:hypothetical protein n=1 Tax=Dokdonella koreensis TaxID=323415 RepID=UPI0012374711|nr:hypothetical protein [Dokdonella koreensis]